VIALIILIAFLAGWILGIRTYKHDLKNSPVVLPPENRYDKLRDVSIELELEANYARRLAEYNRQTEELALMREEFYRENPDCPFKTMYMQVTAPPQKFFINHLK